MNESRKNTRIALRREAVLSRASGPAIAGQTRNISFAGMFIETGEYNGLDVGDICDAVLVLRCDERRVDIALKAEVIHIQQDGVGIRFLSMDIEGYRDFKNLMVLNSPDPDQLLQELEESPGISQPGE